MSAALGKELGARIKGRRLALGLSQEAAAERVGIAPQFLGRIERGLALPSVPTLVAIGAALELPAAALLEPEPIREATEAELQALFEAMGSGQVKPAELGGGGHLVGLVPKALRERMQRVAVAHVAGQRERLSELVRDASPRTLALVLPLLEALAERPATAATPSAATPAARRRKS
jgi:transcriptional regulator with XRE-family HTH domain